MLGMGLTQKQGSFGEKTLQNVAFGIFLLPPGMAERVLRRYYQRRRRAIHLSKSGWAGGRRKKLAPHL